MFRLRTLLILIAVIAASLWIWERADPRDTTSRESRSAASSTIASTVAGTQRGTEPTSAMAAGEPTANAAPAATGNGAIAGSAVPLRTAPSARVRLGVNAPASARVGNSVTITIDADAFAGVRDLAFTVVYDDHFLQFVSAANGSFPQMASAPAKLSAEDPSTGNVLVHLQVDGGVLAGAGTVVVLEFNALQAGATLVTLRDVTLLESDGSTSGTAAVRTASIVIE